MNSWILLSVLGVVFSLAGFLVKRYPPKNINHIYGYRTSSSMKNQTRWDFAQIYSASLMMRMGFIMLLFSIILFLIKLPEVLSTLASVATMLLCLGVMFYKVEKALKKME